jgi:hypothetical protein
MRGSSLRGMLAEGLSPARERGTGKACCGMWRGREVGRCSEIQGWLVLCARSKSRNATHTW